MYVSKLFTFDNVSTIFDLFFSETTPYVQEKRK